MKHPIAVAFGVAVCICFALAALVLTVYTAQEAPWALAAVVLAFPFVWFFAWLATNGLAWWKEMAAPDSPAGQKRKGVDEE